MTRNPLLNAVAATLYIVAIASLLYYAPRYAGTQFTILIPVAVISLFTLSAAIMGFIFLSQPLQLYLDGEKKQAVSLFLQTVAIFAGITTLIFVLVFSGIAALGAIAAATAFYRLRTL